VRLKIDAIVAGGSGDIRAAKEATATIPIVMVQGGDPVGSGFVASLARPWWKHYFESAFQAAAKGRAEEAQDGL
jgi:hypothetical protein